MAQVLLLTTDDVKTFTPLDGNVDKDKYVQYIKIAQDIHAQRYLGTDLLNKLQDDVSADALTGNYLTLVQNYLKPVLIHWTMVEAIPMLAINISNGGIFRHEPENATPLSAEEIRDLVNQEKARAVYYTDRMIDYLVHNSSLFPEYLTNSNEDVSPDRDSNYCSWNL
jgi:hypothetical protein